MLGAIIGDIAGSRFEGHKTNNYHFEIFSGKSRFTDDTVCTIAIADAILKGYSYGESLHHWCRKYPHRGYGGNFRKWIHSDYPHPYNSFGNGSAMRVSAVGWWFSNEEKLADEAMKSAACTHSHEEGIKGAVAVAMAISDCYQLRKNKKDREISREEIFKSGLGRAICQYYYDINDFDVKIEEHRNKFDVTCQGTVPVELAIILNSTNFEDAIRQAVSLGADSDTLGAIVGSIAEALWGIPEWMKHMAMKYLTKEMRHVVREFHRCLNLHRLKSELKQLM